MAQIMINNYNQYQQQIHLLRAHGDVLLERIKILEIKMNIINSQMNHLFVLMTFILIIYLTTTLKTTYDVLLRNYV